MSAKSEFRALAFTVVDRYVERHGHWPDPHDPKQYEEYMSLFSEEERMRFWDLLITEAQEEGGPET